MSSPASESANGEHPLVYVPALNSASKAIRAFVNLRLVEIDLVAGQDALLISVMRNPSITVGHVGNELSVRASTVSKMVDRLSEKGLMQRVRGEGDQRSTRLTLTEAGAEKCQQIVAVWTRLQSELFDSNSEIDLAVMQNSLSQLDDALRKRLSRLR